MDNKEELIDKKAKSALREIVETIVFVIRFF